MAMFSVRGMGVAERVSTSTVVAQLLEPLLVGHAEALLLIDDDQPQVLELHVLAAPGGGCRSTMSTSPRAQLRG